VTRTAWLALAALCATSRLSAQAVMVAPKAVFMSSGGGSGSVTLLNPGTDPVEVAVSVFYGYTATDSTGQLRLVTIDHPDSTQPSAAAWLQAFPRRLTLGPRDQQVVRLLATPPADLPDGEYWARLAFTAKAGELPVTGVSDSAAIKVGLTLQIQQVIGLHYRKGQVRAGIALSELEAVRQGDSVIVHARLERQGNAAYLGTAHAVVVGSNGKPVGELRVPITVFFANRPRWAVSIAGALADQYRLRLDIATQREDLERRVLLQSPSVSDSAAVKNP
jgi:P pilus assembly chaperone PapD